MKIFDISMNINPNMPVYKNDSEKKPVFKNTANFDNSSHYETNLSFNLHTGTHIDAPLHMIKNGNTLDKYLLENLITDCQVIDLTEVTEMITKNDLVKKAIHPGKFILFKTKNSFFDSFQDNFVFLEKNASEYLVNLKVVGVGIDALGIERSQPDYLTHIRLLEKSIIILEGLRLKNIKEGLYKLIALPLKIDNVEASPVRAVLIEE